VYHVYVIYNRQHQKVYIGQTVDLNKRLKEHNDITNDKHVYTKRFGSGWELIYSEPFSSRTEALKREKQLESYQGRLFVKRFIPL
jgi:putative endonuclease